MAAHYEKLAAETDRWVALREVQLEMLRGDSRNHAFYWASFIPIGAGGPIELARPAE
jgi:CHAT domain-containing protein